MLYKDQKYIIEAIISEDYSEIGDFFEELAKQWKNCKLSRNGKIEDVEDTYQEAVISLILRIRSQKSFNSSIYAYFMTICKNKWFDKLKQKKTNDFAVETLPDFSQDVEMQEIRYAIFKSCFKKLSYDCRKLFNMRFNNMSSKEIALVLKTTANNIDQKLYTHREALRKCVEKHPLSNQL